MHLGGANPCQTLCSQGFGMDNKTRGKGEKMKKYVLIQCCKTKRKEPRKFKACELYIGDLFKKSMAYAKSLSPDKIFILSAKHYLLELDKKIEYYDKTLDRKVAKRREWAKKVLDELRKITDLKKDKFIFLASEKYRKYILPEIENKCIPLEGLKNGQQLQWLKAHTP